MQPQVDSNPELAAFKALKTVELGLEVKDSAVETNFDALKVLKSFLCYSAYNGIILWLAERNNMTGWFDRGQKKIPSLTLSLQNVLAISVMNMSICVDFHW